MNPRRLVAALVSAAFVVLALPAVGSATTGTVNEFPVPTAAATPFGITADPTATSGSPRRATRRLGGSTPGNGHDQGLRGSGRHVAVLHRDWPRQQALDDRPGRKQGLQDRSERGPADDQLRKLRRSRLRPALRSGRTTTSGSRTWPEACSVSSSTGRTTAARFRTGAANLSTIAKAPTATCGLRIRTPELIKIDKATLAAAPVSIGANKAPEVSPPDRTASSTSPEAWARRWAASIPTAPALWRRTRSVAVPPILRALLSASDGNLYVAIFNSSQSAKSRPALD